MKVTDKVNEELQCFSAVGLRRSLVGNKFLARDDPIDDVVPVLAITDRIVCRSLHRNVHIVPRAGLPSLSSDLIRPACDLGIRNVHGVTEQIVDGGVRRWFESGLADQVYDLMSVASPPKDNR